MSRLYILVGLPGAGKSTWAKEHCRTHSNCFIASSDFVRKQLFGDESKQYDEDFLRKKYKKSYCEMTESEKRHIGNNTVFSKVDRRTKKLLTEGKDVIYDATSISLMSRKMLVKKFADLADEIIAVYFDVPLSVCLKQNKKRRRRVPESVIRSMASRLTRPSAEEGFNVVLTPGIE